MKEWTYAARLESIDPLTAQVDETLEALECPMKAQLQIDVAIDELFSNIARYAYPSGEGEAMIQLEVQNQPRVIALTFIDHGIPFNPLAADMPDTSLSAEDRPIGGLGIHLVRKTMDEMRYEHRDGANRLTILKKI